MNITSLLHDITQNDYKIEFTNDFEGMITISYYKDEISEYRYIRHEHLSYPGGTPQQLEEKLIFSLNDFLQEIKEDRVEKDGLA